MRRRLSSVAMLWTLLTLNTLAAQPDDRFVSLFDGRSLEGWVNGEGQKNISGWQVEDGCIVRTGGGGSIYTQHEYADFDLRFEWRVSRRGNSGIKYRTALYSPGIYSRREWLGYEYQIWDDANRGASAHTSAAAIYLLQAPASDKQLKPIGQFNSGRIVAIGPHLEHWLNGQKVVDVDTSSELWKRRIANTKFNEIPGIFQNASGRIQLQDHGDKVWFRHLRIREVDAR